MRLVCAATGASFPFSLLRRWEFCYENGMAGWGNACLDAKEQN
jgi:hypothetical protein